MQCCLCALQSSTAADQRPAWHVVQGASKGAAVDRILKKLADEGNAPDFVLCIGDDRSDEDMFIAMEHVTFSPHLTTEVIASPGSPKP